MDSKSGYWQRQFYFLSSLGLFYIIIIALFAIPLLGTFVVILIKGALDLRYVIIAAGCVGLVVLGFIAFKVIRGLWKRFRRDGFIVGEHARRNLIMGKPVEISIFNGLLKFSCGHGQTETPPALTHENRVLLPHQTTNRDSVTGILDQLQQLAELKRTNTIDENEFDLLKAMLIESSSSPDTSAKPNLS